MAHPGTAECVAPRRVSRWRARERRITSTKNTTMNEVSNIPAGGMTRRTGRRTGSVSSNRSVLSDARNVPPRTGNHESTARPARMTR